MQFSRYFIALGEMGFEQVLELFVTSCITFLAFTSASAQGLVQVFLLMQCCWGGYVTCGSFAFRITPRNAGVFLANIPRPGFPTVQPRRQMRAT